MRFTQSPQEAEQGLTGEALRNLREARRSPKIFQRDIAAALGITTQAWQKYEAGEREFKDLKLEVALKTIGATADDLAAERARILGAPPPGVSEPAREFVFDVFGRARAGPQGPEVYDVGEPLRRLDLAQMLGRNTGAMEVAGDSMVPWAEPGEVVLFDRDRYPKRGAGCVIETPPANL